MADKITLVDTSILINYYRKTDKANSVWVKLVRQGYKFSISFDLMKHALTLPLV